MEQGVKKCGALRWRGGAGARAVLPRGLPATSRVLEQNPNAMAHLPRIRLTLGGAC